MNDAPDTLAHPDPAAEPNADDALCVARQLAMLERLADIGMVIAEGMARRVLASAEETSAESHHDISLAYARVAHAVRQTVMLEQRLRRERRHEADAAQSQEMRLSLATQEEVREQIEGVIGRVVQAQHGDSHRADRLRDEAHERLEDEGLYGDVLARPMSEIVADICRDLDLNPDWTCLAREAWAVDEVERGDIGAPLAALPREGDEIGRGGDGPAAPAPGDHPDPLPLPHREGWAFRDASP
jgi:hypothetical protein